MTSTFNPQQLQEEFGLDVGDDDGPESSQFAPVSDRTRNGLTALLEHSARRLVQRATMMPDDHIVRDTKVFVDCVTRIERMNAVVRTSEPAEKSPADEANFVRITKRTRRFLTDLLEHTTVLVVRRARDLTDDHVMRDAKIMIDCVIKVERLNLPDAVRPCHVVKDPTVESQSGSLAELAREVNAIEKQFMAHLRQKENGGTSPLKPAEARP